MSNQWWIRDLSFPFFVMGGGYGIIVDSSSNPRLRDTNIILLYTSHFTILYLPIFTIELIKPNKG